MYEIASPTEQDNNHYSHDLAAADQRVRTCLMHTSLYLNNFSLPRQPSAVSMTRSRRLKVVLVKTEDEEGTISHPFIFVELILAMSHVSLFYQFKVVKLSNKPISWEHRSIIKCVCVRVCIHNTGCAFVIR